MQGGTKPGVGKPGLSLGWAGPKVVGGHSAVAACCFRSLQESQEFRGCELLMGGMKTDPSQWCALLSSSWQQRCCTRVPLHRDGRVILTGRRRWLEVNHKTSPGGRRVSSTKSIRARSKIRTAMGLGICPGSSRASIILSHLASMPFGSHRSILRPWRISVTTYPTTAPFTRSSAPSPISTGWLPLRTTAGSS